MFLTSGGDLYNKTSQPVRKKDIGKVMFSDSDVERSMRKQEESSICSLCSSRAPVDQSFILTILYFDQAWFTTYSDKLFDCVSVCSSQPSFMKVVMAACVLVEFG